ncbi:PH domain-containing protein [Candidatus Gracilibacteria bacterium]|nr:PH domain-containing protein [Candidatus Gracilibacteria bacterium]MCF7819554.1 PH domain-containing protein [Candidatus Gracilibacteria bacterium]
MNENIFHSSGVTLHSSVVLVIFKIVLLQVFFVGIYFLLLWQLNALSPAPLKSGGIILFLVLQSVQLFWSLALFMRWFFRYYELTSKEIIFYQGVLFQQRKSYSLEKVETVTMERSILGRLLKYGTVSAELYMSNARFAIKLQDIPDPEKYVRMLEKAIGDFGTQSSSNDD